MKNRNWFLMGMLVAALFLAGSALAAQEAKVTVLNPRGTPPAIRLIPMAPRLDTLDGKTIYIVDTRYPLTEPFLEELQKVMAKKYPKTTWILRKKIGSYFDDDPKLWAEIKEKGHGAIMAVGH